MGAPENGRIETMHEAARDCFLAKRRRLGLVAIRGSSSSVPWSGNPLLFVSRGLFLEGERGLLGEVWSAKSSTSSQLTKEVRRHLRLQGDGHAISPCVTIHTDGSFFAFCIDERAFSCWNSAALCVW